MGQYTALLIRPGLAKLSILCQYLRVFIDRRTTIATWVTIVFVAAYTVEATALGVFSCVPVAKYWQRQLPGHCMDRPIYYYFNAAMNMLINIIIIIIPIPRLLRLNISNHSKWGMIIAFSFGFVGCIMSAIRLYTIARVSYSNDKSVTSPGPATWTAVELHVSFPSHRPTTPHCQSLTRMQKVSIVCACLPSLRPLLGRIFTLGLLEPTTELASSSSPDDTYSGATHKRTLPSIAWSKAHAHASRLPSASSTSEGKRGFGGDVVEVRSLGDGDGGVRTGGRGRSVELSELEHGIIKVTSTSEVYSSPAVDQDGSGGGAVCGRSSGESESRLTRPGVDQWGYSCEVSVEKDRQYGAS